ncbi:MAG TPA: nucleotidyltransferase domain-containing protein [Candidatus Fraserbacteria bacterium]|nr:nucleotidyltransferase domain-containing protein [Candidatus Fraserbacteria bacterium]
MDIEALAAKLHPVLSTRPEVRLAYLFGSAAQGRTKNKLSDLDIAVLVDEDYYEAHKGGFAYEADLINDLVQALRMNRIDLVLLHKSPPLLAHEVIRKGRLLFCRDAHERVIFEVEVMKRYLDTQPLRQIKRQYLYERIERGAFSEVKLPLSTER